MKKLSSTKLFRSSTSVFCLTVLSSSLAMAAPSGYSNQLINAAERGSTKGVIGAIQAGISPNDSTNLGVTALMRAAYNNNATIAKALIQAGAKVDASDVGGASALHIAARQGSNEVIEVLLHNGAYVNIRDKEGWTPLMRAVLTNKPSTVALLISEGADPTVKNYRGDTVITSAIKSRNENSLRVLQRAGVFNNLSDAELAAASKIAKKKDNGAAYRLLSNIINEKQDTNIISSDTIAAIDESNIQTQAPVTQSSNNLSQIISVTDNSPAETTQDAPFQIAVTSNPEVQPSPSVQPVITASTSNYDDLPASIRYERMKQERERLQAELQQNFNAAQDQTQVFAAMGEIAAQTQTEEFAEFQPIIVDEPTHAATAEPKKRGFFNKLAFWKGDTEEAFEGAYDSREIAAFEQGVVTDVATAPAFATQAQPIRLTPKNINPDTYFLAQLGVAGSPEEANQIWKNARSTYKELFADMEPYVTPVALGQEGREVYRVRVGLFSSHDQAETVCYTLKAQGAECFVVETVTEPQG